MHILKNISALENVEYHIFWNGVIINQIIEDKIEKTFFFMYFI
jgi:hypothetical protein